jgi:RNA polymerase sigma-70 factor
VTNAAVESSVLFETLVREHYDSVHAFVSASVWDGATADDLVQETFVVAWRNLGRYDVTRPFGPWARGVAAKLLQNHRRKQGRSRVIVCDSSILATLEESFRRLDHLRGESFEDKMDALRSCLECLSPVQRQVIAMHYEDDQPCKAIATRLGMQVEAAKKILQRARTALSHCLRRKVDVACEGVA